MWCLISVFVFKKGLPLGSPQNRPSVYRYILQFLKYRTFYKIKFSASNFYFSYYIRSWCKLNIDMPSDGFEINNMYICIEKGMVPIHSNVFKLKLLKVFLFLQKWIRHDKNVLCCHNINRYQRNQVHERLRGMWMSQYVIYISITYVTDTMIK